jgi:recombination protein RecT
MGNELALQNQQIAVFQSELKKNLVALEAVLPPSMSARKIARLAVMELQKNPALCRCSSGSLMLAIMGSCALGLELGGALGQAYLIPYGDTCQLIPGYRGFVKLATNSPEITRITAEVVHEQDIFSYQLGGAPNLEHIPAQPRNDPTWTPGEIIASYSVAWMRDGSYQFSVMNRYEIDKIRDNSPGYKNATAKGKDHPWISHYPEMAKKTPVRLLFKLLPNACEKLQHAIDLDESADIGLPQSVTSIPDMPEIPDDGIIDVQANEPAKSEPSPEIIPPKSEKTDVEKKNEDRLKLLIIRMIEKGVDGKTWLTKVTGRKINRRQDLTPGEVETSHAALDALNTRQPGEEG